MQCCLAVQQSQDGSLGLHTDGGLVNCAVLHNHQSGNAHHTKLHSQFLFLIHINFNNLDIGALLGNFLYQRNYHAARTTPGSPKIHQDGLVHVSQMTERYIKHPLEAVSVGDIVEVKVLSVDLAKKRIALTMKL